MKHLGILLAGLFAATPVVRAASADATSPVRLRTYSTCYSIGIEWDIEGDANHNARTAVQFRRTGEQAWHNALDLFRVDYRGWWKSGKSQADRHYNMMAGSILFLTPGKSYDVRMALNDPDGGSTQETFTIDTPPIPQIPTGGRTLYVVPETSRQGEEGTGTADDPFQGIAAADAQARPGDVFLLQPGTYGQVTLTHSGEGDNRVVWRSDDGRAVLHGLTLEADNVWLQGLTFQNREDLHDGLLDREGHDGVVVCRNTFEGFPYSLNLDGGSNNWYITDNTIIGDKQQMLDAGEAPGQLSGEGVELHHSEGHVVAYNQITQTADAVSYPGRNVDIFGNDIRNVTDDGVEPDYGYANTRIWGNRMHNVSNFRFSFQPMFCGPWYIIRNQATGQGKAYKFNGPTDRFLTAHNTFVNGDRWPVVLRAQALLHSVSRNNLYIKSGGDGPVWQAREWGGVGKSMPENNFSPYWQTDVDYDGFAWMQSPGIVWNGQEFDRLDEFARASGIEQHAIRIDPRRTFENFADGPVPLTLRPGSRAVDAGGVLPNINDDYVGSAPDLGAFEVGRPLPHYGPRDEDEMAEHTLYWSRWGRDDAAQ